MERTTVNDLVTRSTSGRKHFWAGLGFAVLGIALCGVQYFALKETFVPWYWPAITTAGALLSLIAVLRRPSIVRIAALVLVTALAGFEWFFVASFSKLPPYTGTVQVGSPMPAFQTTLADGRPFTEADLQQAPSNVITFFRGRCSDADPGVGPCGRAG